jgi:hypothetical protein
MSENIAAIRRESVKYECIADQIEGHARKLSIAKAITYEVVADILEDPEKMEELFRLATGKPNLRLVTTKESGSDLQKSIFPDRVSALLDSLWSDFHDKGSVHRTDPDIR